LGPFVWTCHELRHHTPFPLILFVFEMFGTLVMVPRATLLPCFPSLLSHPLRFFLPCVFWAASGVSALTNLSVCDSSPSSLPTQSPKVIPPCSDHSSFVPRGQSTTSPRLWFPFCLFHAFCSEYSLADLSQSMQPSVFDRRFVHRFMASQTKPVFRCDVLPLNQPSLSLFWLLFLPL